MQPPAIIRIQFDPDHLSRRTGEGVIEDVVDLLLGGVSRTLVRELRDALVDLPDEKFNAEPPVEVLVHPHGGRLALVVDGELVEMGR